MSRATIVSAAGPVVRARMHGAFHVLEALAVGERGLLGEVVQLDGDLLVAQVYEDTTGLAPGMPVVGRGGPLSIRLGPGLLGRLYDGLLRPLEAEASAAWRFEAGVARGDPVCAGAVYGRVDGEPCLVPPGIGGEVIDVVPDGPQPRDRVLARVRDARGAEHGLRACHAWPVRTPRPVAERLPPEGPLITGQRVLDTLFPVARGGRAALPGGFGTGKTILQESIAKWCDADVIVYVGCGERGNEMAEVLDEFPTLEDPRTGRPLMERAIVIANTSNMPVAAREASIYTAVTVAEYFRDLGRHVALMADSTSRWAEALREVSGRLGELPGEAGYPAYLSTRLAGFYERAARVRTLGGAEGSLTIVGAVSPPAGDFSEPVTLHTRRYVRSFWALDPNRARARFYPAIDPLGSYSEDVGALAAWWQAHGDSEWERHRERLLALLERQARLERMARIVGRDALPAEQQLALLLADVAAEALLRQSAFSPVDRYCSPARQAAMLRLVIRLLDAAERAVAAGTEVRTIAGSAVLQHVRRLADEHGEDDVAGIEALAAEIETAWPSAPTGTDAATATPRLATAPTGATGHAR
ncbi:MAG: V-type ATP synthase subunit A [Steroidobacteraceae bacterium]|nr:V-type ATP synthase subunit A [Steroidobacteraceae bacterium]